MNRDPRLMILIQDRFPSSPRILGFEESMAGDTSIGGMATAPRLVKRRESCKSADARDTLDFCNSLRKSCDTNFLNFI